MYTFRKVVLVTVVLLGTITSGYSQKGGRSHGNGSQSHGRNKPVKVMVKQRPGHPNQKVFVKSPYKPSKIIVYHPHWRPNYGYHRRWVYFPRYNFYWDNWRQGYYYMNGPVWVFNATPPPVIVNINLEKETNYELKENEDDIDDVYKTNGDHQKEFRENKDK